MRVVWLAVLVLVVNGIGAAAVLSVRRWLHRPRLPKFPDVHALNRVVTTHPLPSYIVVNPVVHARWREQWATTYAEDRLTYNVVMSVPVIVDPHEQSWRAVYS